jgi:hypothetical protein
VSSTHFKVIGVVCRCDLDGASAGRRIDGVICNDRDTPLHERVIYKFSMKVLLMMSSKTKIEAKGSVGYLIPSIVGVDSNRGISQHSLWASGRHNDFFLCNRP